MGNEPQHVPGRGDESRLPDDRANEAVLPQVFIPWGPQDDGVRGAGNNIPPWVIWYYWPGIHVFLPDGSPYLGGKIPPNQTSTMVIDVANSGADGAYAEVDAFWTDPSPSFGSGYLNQGPVLGEPTGVWVPPYSTVQAPPITVHPQDKPPHFCVIARVKASGSAPDGTWSPYSDNHYAQHNLDVKEVGHSGRVAFPVQLVNPFEADAFIDVTITSAVGEQLRWFAQKYRSEPTMLPPAALQLRAVDRNDDRQNRSTNKLRLPIPGRGRLVCQAMISADHLEPGGFTAIEIHCSIVPEGDADEWASAPIEGSYGAIIVRS